jgi:hypothetical protein
VRFRNSKAYALLRTLSFFDPIPSSAAQRAAATFFRHPSPAVNSVPLLQFEGKQTELTEGEISGSLDG